MDYHAWIAIGVVVVCLGLLIAEVLAAELVMMLGVVILMVTGTLDPGQALSGFSNEGMITVAAMYIIAMGLRETGAIDFVVLHLLGRPKSVTQAQLRVIAPTLALSAFVNNTPVVAAFLPAVLAWAKRSQIAPSKVLIPLSYAAILGGTCTLIGTSTNLVVNGLWVDQGFESLGMFDITWVGVPATLVGAALMVIFGNRLLPDRRTSEQTFGNPREYTVEMMVDGAGPLVGKTILEAGLRNLGSLFLVEIQRDGRIVPAVSSEERLLADDRLVFAGDISTIVDLQRLRGLVPAFTESAALTRQFPERKLVEVVVSAQCPLIGQTLRESRFHTYYGASVIAVARDGKRVEGSLGNIRLRAADTLLLEARPVWVERHRQSPDFLLVSEVEGSEAPRFDRGVRAWLILIGVVITATAGWLEMVTAALVGAGLTIATGCVSLAGARRSLDAQVLIVIAASLALGKALQSSGAAEVIAASVLTVAGDHPWVVLALAYGLVVLLTEVISNNAAAALMFPIMLATADSLEASPMPFVIALMMGASCGFSTPIGYQTNLMVAGPGGYRFSDFLRAGVPLNLVIGAVVVGLTPLVYPFYPGT